MIELAFNILWVSKCEYPAKHVIKPHQHDFYHLIFVLNGSGNILVGDSIHEMKINQLYLVKPNIRHGIYASKTRVLNTVEFKFWPGNEAASQMLMKLEDCNKNISITIRNVFVNIIEEIKRQNRYYEEVLNLELMQIVYYLSRDSDIEVITLESNDKRDECESGLEKYNALKKVTNYIKENYWMELSLSDLAAMVNLSPAYFCSLFKESYGISPINYLHNVRVECAKQLLEDTNKSVTDIAFEVGYQSIHYFSRYFKNHEGISPNDFRRRTQGYICKDFIGSITDFSKGEG